MKIIVLIFFICLSGCTIRSNDYRDYYSYLHSSRFFRTTTEKNDYSLIIFVDACHLDYTDTSKFIGSIAKHPNGGSKEGDVGHVWIRLEGIRNGEKICVEGGHSGEICLDEPRYCDGIMDYNDSWEPNPIKYLWKERHDGFFQKGSGGHQPTFAAIVSLSEDQFYTILRWIDPENYDYSKYSLVKSQCCSFASQVALLAGIEIDSRIRMKMDPVIYFGGRKVRLWEDSDYSEIIFYSPDAFEKSLVRAVKEGKAHCFFYK